MSRGMVRYKSPRSTGYRSRSKSPRSKSQRNVT